jgi:16S rRNA (uracil1498-N3)-methyltransferase
MARHRLFASSDNAAAYVKGAKVAPILDDQTIHHAKRVLRLRVQEQIEIVVCDEWTTYLCEVIDLSKGIFEVLVIEEIAPQELPVICDLYWGLSKGDKNERIVRQATEIGFTNLTPVAFQRSIHSSQNGSAHKQERLKAIAQAAAMQSHRSIVPTVNDTALFEQAIESLSHYDAVIVLWEEANGIPLSLIVDEVLSTNPARIGFVVGPEGGITKEEIESIRMIGGQLADLGDSILRVETACTVVCGIADDRIRVQRQQPTAPTS